MVLSLLQWCSGHEDGIADSALCLAVLVDVSLMCNGASDCLDGADESDSWCPGRRRERKRRTYTTLPSDPDAGARVGRTHKTSNRTARDTGVPAAGTRRNPSSGGIRRRAEDAAKPPDTVCLSCTSDRFLIAGRCVRKYTCNARRIDAPPSMVAQFPWWAAQPCRCIGKPTRTSAMLLPCIRFTPALTPARVHVIWEIATHSCSLQSVHTLCGSTLLSNRSCTYVQPALHAYYYDCAIL